LTCVLLPGYSPDGRLFACWPSDDSHVRVWDTQTGQVVGKFRTARVDEIALSPALIKYSPGNRLIALGCGHGTTIGLFDLMDGWVMGRDNEPLFWVPVEYRDDLHVQPSYSMAIGASQRKATSMDLSNSRLGRQWTECIDKWWLRELEQKEKDIGNLLEKYVLSSVKCSNE